MRLVLQARTIGVIARGAALAAGLVLLAACSTQPKTEAPATPAQPTTTQPAQPSFTQPPGQAENGTQQATGSPSYGTSAPFTHRIALVLPLSGRSAGIGHDLLDAATLALFDINSNRIELLVADSKGTPDGAVSAMKQVVAAKPDLIVGPLFSPEVKAAAPIARQAGIGMIALSSDLTVAEPGVYLLGLPPEEQVDRVVSYAASQGYLRFGVLAPDDAFGQRMAQALQASAERRGGQVTASAFYNPDGIGIDDTVRQLTSNKAQPADLEAEIAKLQARGDQAALAAVARLQAMEASGTPLAFDALFVPASGSLMREVAAYLGYYDVTPAQVRLLGLAGWDDRTLLREPVLRGAWFAAPPSDRRKWFEKRFQSTYGHDAPRVASLGYDAMALAAALARGGGKAGDFSADAITNWRGFAGVNGIFRFDKDGKPQRGLAVMEIQPDGFKVAAPAPTSFSPPAVSMANP